MSTTKAAKPKASTKSAAHARTPSRKPRTRQSRPAGKWSGDVTEKSDALDLEKGVFTADNPETIAKSLKRSAVASRRRKTDAFRSALSMLTFYINRAGKNLSASRRRTLTAAKNKLRQFFGRKRKLSIKRVQ